MDLPEEKADYEAAKKVAEFWKTWPFVSNELDHVLAVEWKAPDGKTEPTEKKP